jgi:hypothetical protein
MKRIFSLLSVIFLILQSCSSSDSTTTNQVSLISKWNLDKSLLDNTTQILSTCDKQGYIEFYSNGTFERKDYYLNGTSCILEGFDSGTYTYNSSANRITLNFLDPNDGPQIETLNNFNISSTTLKYSWDENVDGTDEYNLEFKK